MEKFKCSSFTAFLVIICLPYMICSNSNPSEEVEETAKIRENISCNLNVIPFQYEINIGPIQNDSEPVNVPAWVKIKLEIGETECNLSNIVNFAIKLNVRDCKIDLSIINFVKIANNEHKQLKIMVQLLEENSTENLIINFHETLTFGDQVILYIPYEIQLTRDYYEESWQGLYYYDPQGTNISDEETAYEYYPLHAQFMFPAFDYFNPIRKPTFKISVARNNADGFISLSNSKFLESIQIAGMDNGWVMDIFEETPPMQLDQVTLMILGGYQNHTIFSAKNCTLNMWTLKEDGKLHGNKSAFNTVEFIKQTMNFFESVFYQTEYSLSKIDFIAVPWYTGGLVFYSNLGIMVAPTNLMLLNEDLDIAMTKGFLRTQVVFQWFRGMVTSGIFPQLEEDEEDDVWINGECLARYVGVWPLKDTKFMNTGTATYSFHLNIGKFLLEMLESIFSQKIMETAIAEFYLPKVLKDGAFPQDLYESLQQAIELHNSTHISPQVNNETVTVTEIFNSWLTKKYNYPTIRITQVINDTSSIALYQEKSSETGPIQMWWVPLKILTKKGNLLEIWLSPNHNSLNSSYKFSTNNDSENDWYFVNPDSTGYYSTKYSDKLLQNIVKQLELNHLEFSVVARKYLVYNQFIFCKSNKWDDIKGALEITKYLNNEKDLDVWTIAIEQMAKFDYKFLGYSSSYKKYFGKKINEVLEKIGVHSKEGEIRNISELRRILMKLCSSYEIPLCTDYATNLMNKWMESNSSGNWFREKIDYELEQALYCAAVKNGNASVFNFMLNQVIEDINSSVLNEKWYWSREMCRALACVKDEDLLGSLLSENGTLATATIEKKGTLSCYLEYIPFEILFKRPSMKKTVIDFWMRETLNGNMEPGSLMRCLWTLIPKGYEPPEFVEGILKFLEDHDNLFTEDLRDNVRDFKTNFANGLNRIEEFWKDGTGGKMVKWFEMNME